MTNGKNKRGAKTKTATATLGIDPPKPITGVNKDNYYALGAAFMRANGGIGFCVVRDQWAGSPEFPWTPREWHAWAQYFRVLGFKPLTLEKLGKGAVPSQWPHQFDDLWSKINDDEIVVPPEVAYVARGAIEALTRKQQVKRELGYDPAKGRPGPEPKIWPNESWQPPEPKIDISDLPDGN